MINVVSGILLAVFLFSYFFKLYLLKRRQVHAYHLGDKAVKKSSAQERAIRFTSFLWIILWAVEIAASAFSITLPFSFHGIMFLSAAGLAVTAGGLFLFIAAMAAMRNSWRVGIDENIKTEFVSRGVYRYSRNPAFAGFDLMFIGLLLIYPDIFTAAVLFANLYTFHRLILCEEAYLLKMHGDVYEEYKMNTARYYHIF